MDNFVLTCCSTVDLDEAFFEKREEKRKNTAKYSIRKVD